MAKHGGFPGGGMGGGMNMNMVRQAQKMQQDILKLQEELKTREYEASSGGGVITAKVNGDHRVVSINIKPEAVDPDDAEMLSDMITAAINEAMKLADDTTENEMKKVTGGLNLGF